MNSSFRSVQILIDLLKQFGITDVVLSPGGSDIPLIHAMETDESFTCYSVVDERSAAYFAMGMAQQKNRAVACVCTSGTAVCNYVPGITEAFYQNVPVLAITADKNPYYQGQLETQKIEQTAMFAGVVKKSVSLPLIHDGNDEWLCNRLVNEALLALNHHGKGPVQINVPIVGRTDLYNDDVLPKERKVSIVDMHSEGDVWAELADKARKAKRVMVVVGQNVVFSAEEIELLNAFYEKTNCIFAVEHLSNLACNGCVNTYPISEMRGGDTLSKYTPDLVISFGNNLAAYNLKPFLRLNYRKMENWLVSESGELRDAYKSLTQIFEMPVADFLGKLTAAIPERHPDSGKYCEEWKKETQSIRLPDFGFSNLYVAQELAKVIPANSVLHLAILNSTRTMQFFPLADGVKTYSNVGGLGIDGCLSTFAGQAAATDELAYLVIGDLSFFYDMNAAGLRSIGPNVRIILLNNCGGSEFHFFIGNKKIPTINDYISAEHSNIAAGWAISLGYDYYCASTREEFDAVIGKFGEKSDAPMFLEVLTDMENDAAITREFYASNAPQSAKAKTKSLIKKMLSDKTIAAVRKLLHK